MSLNEPNTGPHGDNELERELAALGHAYRSSADAADDVVPPSVDDAIRAAARRSVHARPQSLRKAWLFGWGGPVAAAAVVVLTVSIGMLSVEEQPELVPEELKKAIAPRASQMPPPTPAPEANMPVEAAAPQGRVAVVPEKRAEKILERRYDKAAGASQDKGEAHVSRDNKPEPEFARQIAQAHPGSSMASGLLESAKPVRKSASIGARGREEVDLITRPDQVPAPTATVPALTSALAPSPFPAPATPPLSGKAETVAPAAPVALAKEKFDRDRFQAESKNVDEARSARLTSPVIAPQSPNEGVAQNKILPAPFAAPDALADKAASRDTAQPALGAVTASGTAVQPSSGEKQGSAATPKDFRTKGADKAEKAKAPQEWLKQIMALKEQGKDKEAKEELAKFRKRYPDYVLPRELRE